MSFKSISEIKAANEALGQFWFTEGAMAFFNTRIHEDVIMGRYFITSDSPDDLPESRKYSVRRADDEGRIDTVGEFMAYATKDEARHAAYDAASAECITGSGDGPSAEDAKTNHTLNFIMGRTQTRP